MKARIKRRILAGLMPIYVADLFFSFHYNSVIYVNSSFLEKFFSVDLVSLLFILGSLGSIILFFLATGLEKRLGNRIFFFLFLILEALAIAGLATIQAPIYIAVLFILFQSTSVMIFYSLDIFLEDATPEKETGSVRGTYLTLLNLAVLLSPMMIAFFAPNGEFIRLYIMSLFCLIPLFLLGIFSFKHFKDARQHFNSLPIISWWKHKDIRRVTLVRLTLNIFYSLAVIYIPIYLHQNIGFSWTEISIVFTIMLLPFVLFEIPVGRLADKWCGEKEFMTLGLFILGTTLLIIPFLKTPSVVAWAALLFISRIGASFIEIASESYFFKQVNTKDLGMISIFRITWPVAFIIGPFLAILSINTLGFTGLLLLMALFVFKTMNSSTKLRDTL